MSPASKAAGSIFIFSRSSNLLLKISSYAALATLKTGQAPYLKITATKLSIENQVIDCIALGVCIVQTLGAKNQASLLFRQRLKINLNLFTKQFFSI